MIFFMLGKYGEVESVIENLEEMYEVYVLNDVVFLLLFIVWGDRIWC